MKLQCHQYDKNWNSQKAQTWYYIMFFICYCCRKCALLMRFSGKSGLTVYNDSIYSVLGNVLGKTEGSLFSKLLEPKMFFQCRS